MAEILEEINIDEIDYDSIVIEDDEPVDSIFSEKQQRLLVETLHVSWKPERLFMASANVGIFYHPKEPAIVPDMYLSLDVKSEDDIKKRENLSYFVWKYGKPPEVAAEVVSNTRGGELDRKVNRYALIGVLYYVVLDPLHVYGEEELCVFQLHAGRYMVRQNRWLEKVGLGLTLWEGEYEGWEKRWLRWIDDKGQLLLTGQERSTQEERRADYAEQAAFKEWLRAEQERQRAEQAEAVLAKKQERVERLAARLRALGIEPEDEEKG